MKKSFVLVLAVLMVLSSIAVCFAEDAEPIRAGIVFGTAPSGATYIDGDPSKGISGIEGDILKEVVECMGRELEYQEVTWDGLFTGLLSNKWDISACSIFVTAEREEMMDFSDPYMDMDMCFMVRNDNPIDTVEDLKGKILCADAGAGGEDWLREHEAEYGPYTIQTYTGTTGMWADVLAGRCDAGIGDSAEIEFYTIDYPEMRPSLYLGMGYKVAYAFRPDDPNLEAFNQCQRELKKSGRIEELYKQHMGCEPQPGSAVYELYEDGPYIPEN